MQPLHAQEVPQVLAAYLSGTGLGWGMLWGNLQKGPKGSTAVWIRYSRSHLQADMVVHQGVKVALLACTPLCHKAPCAWPMHHDGHVKTQCSLSHIKAAAASRNKGGTQSCSICPWSHDHEDKAAAAHQSDKRRSGRFRQRMLRRWERC